MFNTLEFVRKNFPFLDVAEAAKVIAGSKLKKLKAGEVLIQQGQIAKYPAFYIAKGILRGYVTKNGVEKTVLLRRESEFMGAPPTMFRQQPTEETIVAVEDCVILLMDWGGFRKLARKNASVGRAYSEALEKMLLDSVDRIQDLTTLSAEERYKKFVQENKQLVGRVPWKHVASYIGIVEQSLSRIRARLSQSNT